MVDAYKIADGYVEITSRVDEKAVKKDADKAGEQFEEKFSNTVSTRLKRGKHFKEVGAPADHEGRRSGSRFGSTFVKGLKATVKGLGKGAVGL